MLAVTRKIEFDAGHRLIGHESKCAHLHGHRYVLEVSMCSTELDGVGRVVDFSCIKNVFGGWIDENWDHNMILNVGDPLFKLSAQAIKTIFANKIPYAMDHNPTAENMVKHLAIIFRRLMIMHEVFDGLVLSNLRLWETPNCFVDYDCLQVSEQT